MSRGRSVQIRRGATWFWNAVTAPSPAIASCDRRRRARMLAALLLFLLLCAAVLTLVLPWLLAPGEHRANRELAATGVGVLVAGSVIYGLSRSRHYESAAWLAVVTTIAAVTVSAYISQDTIWLPGAPYFLALGLILAVTLLPITAALLVVPILLLLPVLLFLTIPSFGLALLANAVTFLAVFSAAVTATGILRHQDLHQIHAQAAALRESEERSRALFAASFEGVLLHANGRVLEANLALARLWRCSPASIADTSFDALFVEESRPHVRRAVQATHHTTSEAVARRADGSTFPVEFITKPHLHRGRIIQATALRDVTVRKETETARRKAHELELANRRLQEAERLKTRILNVTSHELNTPMTPLRMQVHLLKGQHLGPLTEKQQRVVQLLERNLRRLGVLVSDILDVTRLESGQLRLTPERFEVCAAARDAVAAYAEAARERGVRLRVASAGDAWIHGDPVRIDQVLTNLVSNALKFTPPGGTIHVRVHAPDGVDGVRIEVQDTGIGLDAAQRARLFRPFQQVHDSALTSEPGTGLGLYISKEIVAAHGGSLRVESPGRGRGCTFLLALPAGGPGAAALPGR